jgi:hypothetical protein
MFLRFICAIERGRDPLVTGPFVALDELESQGRLDPHEAAWTEELYAWFNRHLPVPPFRARRFPERALCWFIGGKNRALARMWELAAVLRAKDVPMQVLRTRDPGQILYADPFQVVAQLPRQRARRPLSARRRAI